MDIFTRQVSLSTKGRTHIIDITKQVQEAVSASNFTEGRALAFAIGSTAGITTVEYEPGLVETDLPALFEKLAPYGKPYAHDNTWGDDNGAAHLRASLLGCSLTVPFVEGTLCLGTWQQIIYIDFDTRSRARKLIVQVSGK